MIEKRAAAAIKKVEFEPPVPDIPVVETVINDEDEESSLEDFEQTETSSTCDVILIEDDVDSNESADPEVLVMLAKWLQSPDGGKKDEKTAKQHVSQIKNILSLIDAERRVASLFDCSLLKNKFVKCAEQKYVPQTISQKDGVEENTCSKEDLEPCEQEAHVQEAESVTKAGSPSRVQWSSVAVDEIRRLFHDEILEKSLSLKSVKEKIAGSEILEEDPKRVYDRVRAEWRFPGSDDNTDPSLPTETEEMNSRKLRHGSLVIYSKNTGVVYLLKI